MLSQFQPCQECALQAGGHGELLLRQTTAGSKSLKLFAETLNSAHGASGTKAGDNAVSLHRKLCRAKDAGEAADVIFARRTHTITLCLSDAQ